MLHPLIKDLIDELRTLDQMPHSHHDTAFIFYVRAGKSTKEEIYASALGRNRNQLDTNFVDFLFSLGETTPIDTHSYWSGNVKSSYRIGLQKTKGTNFIGDSLQEIFNARIRSKRPYGKRSDSELTQYYTNLLLVYQMKSL